MINLKEKRIYWYPGSGNDLMPILLMAPQSHRFGEHLEGGPVTGGKPGLCLWLTDLQGGGDPEAYFLADQPYRRLWKQFGVAITHVRATQLAELNESFSGDSYLVEIKVDRQGISENYTFIFTVGDARDLYKDFIDVGLNLTWLALIKFNAMSGTIGMMPRLLERNIANNGIIHSTVPELVISDGYFQYPNLPFERLGSRDRHWGDPNTRRIRGGGIRGWGFGTSSTNWCLSDRYDHYAGFL